jgi:hypothetical protein
MKILRGAILGALLAPHALAKELPYVFTSINSCTETSNMPNGAAYNIPQLQCNVSWVLDPEIAQVGDTFSLSMPEIFVLTRTATEDTAVNEYIYTPFDLTVSGVQLATCNYYGGGPFSLNSQIQCQVTADLSRYSAVEGTLEFFVVINKGWTAEAIDAAKFWQVGSNTVTFNGDLSTQVTLPLPADYSIWGQVNDANIPNNAGLGWTQTNQENQVFLFYSPLQLCGGQGIQGGNLSYTFDNSPSVTFLNIEVYMSNQFNSLNSPMTAESVPGLSISISPSSFVATFDTLPAGYIVWASVLMEPCDPWQSPSFLWHSQVVCTDGSTDSNAQGWNMGPVPQSLAVTGQCE